MNVWDELLAAAAEAVEVDSVTARLRAAVERCESPTLMDDAEPPAEPFDSRDLAELEFDPSALDALEPGGWRSTDPDTSREAALSHTPSSASMRLRLFVVIARAEGGSNCDEALDVLGLPHETVSPRLAELRKRGWIRDSGEKRRPAKPGKKNQIVWVPTDQALAEARARGLIQPAGQLALA